MPYGVIEINSKEDAVAYSKDPLGYYGMSIHDFI